MYCLHCKYTTKLRNDKEINALFALYEGVQQSLLHQQSSTRTNITILPQIAKNFWRKISFHRLHRCAQIRRVWHPCHTHAATKLSSHRIHGTHRNDWRRISSHRLHGYAQIRRVWHPCHTHAATKLSSHRIHGTHRNDWRRRKICVHLCNLWENILRLKLLCIL